jgi:hypothetical protein
VFESLPAHCLSHVRLQPGAGRESDTAVYDITICAPDGRVLVDIADFTMMRVGATSSVTPRTSEAPGSALLQFQGAITPAEGLDAFRRVLAARLPGQLVISPQHLETYLAALKEQARPAAPPLGAPATDLVDASQVERALAAHEAVAQAVVVAHKSRDGEVKATAFVVWELGEQLTVAEIRRFLKERVPEELLPQQLVELEELPRDGSGAVDRSALPDPFAPKDDYVAPSSDTEKTIAGIWKELLGVARVSVHDNFLDVGGHSLLAMRAISRIAKQTGVRLNPSVMTLNTLSQIAAECDAKVAATT